MQTITESDMTFGPYSEGHCFHIEKSETYKTIQVGVNISEFLLLKSRQDNSPQICIIEAKSSSPHPSAKDDFEIFLREIKEKMKNGLGLGLASILKRHAVAENELSQDFLNIDVSKVSFRFVLVVNGHKKEWLPGLQDALAKELQVTRKIWNLGTNPVAVMNEEVAREHGLIQ